VELFVQIPQIGDPLLCLVQQRMGRHGFPQITAGPSRGRRSVFHPQQALGGQTGSFSPSLVEMRADLLEPSQRHIPFHLQETGGFADFAQAPLDLLFAGGGTQGQAAGLPYLGRSVGLQALQKEMKFQDAERPFLHGPALSR